MLKVTSQPWVSGSEQIWLRYFKWGTVDPCRLRDYKSIKSQPRVHQCRVGQFLLDLQLWPHLKDLTHISLESEAQGVLQMLYWLKNTPISYHTEDVSFLPRLYHRDRQFWPDQKPPVDFHSLWSTVLMFRWKLVGGSLGQHWRSIWYNRTIQKKKMMQKSFCYNLKDVQ